MRDHIRKGIPIWLFALILLCLAGCAPSPSGKATLDTVEPSRVSSMVDTTLTLRGQNLFLSAAIDLESNGGADLGRSWRVEIGGIGLPDVVFVDIGNLTARLPKGMAAGQYEVKLFTPEGKEVVAPGLIEIVDEPVGLPLSIEDASGGSGTPIDARNLQAGESLAAFAVVRDTEGSFLQDIEVLWALDGMIGSIAEGPSSSVTLLATTVGVGQLTVARDTALPDTTGDLTVVAGEATALFVVDGLGPTASDIGDQSLTTDDAPTYFALSRDAFGNYVADVNANWSLAGAIGLLSSSNGLSSTFDATTPGNGVVTATATGLTGDSTGTLTIEPGRANALAIIPDTLVISSDAAPFAFTATGTDADGNVTSDRGDLTWTVGAGVISTFVDPSAGDFTPTVAGIGQVRVTSSYGATSLSGNIEVQPGAAARLTVAPDTQTLSADDAPATFSVTGVDNDGNATADLGTILWTVSQGAIDVLNATSGLLDPQTAGTGRITATSSHPGVFDESGDITIEPGIAANLVVEPDILTIVEGDTPVVFGVVARDADNNETLLVGVLSWLIESGPIAAIDTATGEFSPTTLGVGSVRATSSHGAGVTDVTGDITVLQQATLGVAFTVPVEVSEGQTFAVTMRVSNTGASGAAAVVPSALTLGGTSTATLIAGPSPASADIAAGSFVDFAFSYTAGAAGNQTFSGSASGTDTTTGNAVGANVEVSSAVLVETPADLDVTLVVTEQIGLGSTFVVTMEVRNDGQAGATNVVPDSPLVASGTANVTEVSGPAPASSAIASGATVTFEWTYSADSLGDIQFTGGAEGVDENSGDSVLGAPGTSSVSTILEEAVLMASDPFGDGTEFAFVFAYDGQIFLGPAADGSSALRMQPDGTGAQSVNFSIAKDTDGDGVSSVHSNNSASPYTSFGSAGCTANTLACGPDNEDGRGFFASGIMNGNEEWVVAGGSRSAGNLDYVYMSIDKDYNDLDLDFRYVDVNEELGGGARGFAAAHFFADDLYLSFPDDGGGQPKISRLRVTPPDPGFNPAGAPDIYDLQAFNFMANATDPSMVDAIWDFGDRLYIANTVGCFRATNTNPRDETDFTECTPNNTVSGGAYANKTSFQTTKLSEIEPADRAVPAFATYTGAGVGDLTRLFMARNTTNGPQLWSCTPGADGGPIDQCARGDWSLIAGNTVLDGELSQFDNANNTHISFLAATKTALYVGYDNPVDGIVLFKTEVSNPTTAADFVGQGACPASNHPASCEGLGGNGFGFAPPGPPSNVQIFNGIIADFAATETGFMVVGDGTAGVKIYRIF